GAGSEAGASGKDVQAVRMRLTGEASAYFDVCYRAYVKGVGWMGWAKGGQDAGSVGVGKPMLALQARIVPRGHVPKNDGSVSSDPCLNGGGGQLLSHANARQRRIVQATNTTPWPGPGLCAGWVEDVYNNAGLGRYSGNACDLYDQYCKSSNKNDLKVGMIIAVRTHTRTNAGSIWGHVGIYVGDGWVAHSVTGGVKKVKLDYWIDYYGTTVTPKWGWLGNVNVA
ncbi:MAG: C40 family peptidase, partial [Atopobiaceae bacterium]|nr:C40 family peptidase [Atopobiaceae bacterium]